MNYEIHTMAFMSQSAWTNFLDVAFALCLLIGKLPILVDKGWRNNCVISIIYIIILLLVYSYVCI